MQYKLQCSCGATAWVSGEVEDDTNALVLSDTAPLWEGGDEAHEHEESKIVDSDYDDGPTDG